MPTRYKVHPAIGVARVGNSEEYYYAPEEAGGLPILVDGGEFTRHSFRDADHRVRRQAARFRIFKYDDDGPSGREVGPGIDGITRIEWAVHLANKKASWHQFMTLRGSSGYSSNHPFRNPQIGDPAERLKLIIDPGPRTLTGPGQSASFARNSEANGYPMTFPPKLQPFPIDTLGEIHTDDRNRLVVVGGHGHSGSMLEEVAITDYANNSGWFDDTSDGPVTARLIMDDGRTIDVDDPAWVIVTPPKFAPQLVNVVTLHDAMFDTAVRFLGARPDIYRDGLWSRNYQPDYTAEIEPILRRPELYHWAVAIPPHPHSPPWARLQDPDPQFNGLRRFYMHVFRPPDLPNAFAEANTGMPMMPYLLGDNPDEPEALASHYFTLTPTQYYLLQRWSIGAFHTNGGAPERGGAALDRAALDNCVGGAFCPGIEMGWICRNPAIYAAPYRIRHRKLADPPLSLGQDFAFGLEPGDLTKYMAQPWQSDFNECSVEPVGDRFLWWWPAQRPLFVMREHEDGSLRQTPWIGTSDDQNADGYLEFTDDLLMVSDWSKLGFLFNVGTAADPRLIEVDRLLRRRARE